MSQEKQEVVLKRDCPAKLVPSGTPVTLMQGEKVIITQALGGAYTVNIRGNLAQIDAQDADALGFEKPETVSGAGGDHQKPDETQIWDALKTCYDPEIPINIVDLGLIYSMEIVPHPDEGYQVEIKMTLTAPGCGMGPYIAEDVRRKVSQVAGVKDVKVELVWDPPWDKDMMSEAAKMRLGMM